MSLAPLLAASPAMARVPAAVAAFAFAAVQPTVPIGQNTTLAKSLCRDVSVWQPASESAACSIEPGAH